MMSTELLCYVFINSLTGNVIGYHTLPAALENKSRHRQLELKKTEVAVANKLLVSTIYWKLQE